MTINLSDFERRAARLAPSSDRKFRVDDDFFRMGLDFPEDIDSKSDDVVLDWIAASLQGNGDKTARLKQTKEVRKYIIGR